MSTKLSPAVCTVSTADTSVSNLVVASGVREVERGLLM
jgi:hypothetical protein